MQGPVEQIDHDNAQTYMLSSQSENTSGKCSMNRQVLLRVESGACNVCAAPCSSCMHFNQGFMRSKTVEFSDETSHVNMTSQNFANAGDVSSSCKRKACDSVQNTTSETSNLISANSNHGSLSENADSKAIPRSADTTDALEVEMHPKLSSVKNAEWVEQYPKARACLNRYEDSIGAHDDDDNISCISRGNDVHVTDSNPSRNVDKKNLSCSSASISSLNKEYARRAHEPISSHMPSSNHTASRSSSLKEKAPAKCPRGLVDKEPSPKEAATDDYCGKKSGSHKNSDVFSNMCLNQAETINDERKPTDEAFMCEQDRKSSEFNMQELPPQSVSGNESDESDVVELDVKVCDICGDAGREDLLAICSRCSDGAEHTYCMQKMHKKVPRGNWLCEECKFSQGTNSQNQVAEIEGRSTNKASSSMRFSGKRLADNVDMAPVAKRQALETIVVSPKSPSPVKPSRESSFKNLDREKPRAMPQTTLGSHSTDTAETQRSATTIPRLQTLKGILSKSNSFNSKPKVKLVDEVIPQKKKGAKEQTSLDMLGRPTRLLGKSMSFKSATTGRLNASDSKVKMLSPKELNHVLDSKGLKQPKDRTAFERKALTKIDRPAVSSTPSGSSVSTPKVDHQSHVESSSTSSLSNNKDLKVAQCEGKSSNPSKLEGNIVHIPNIPVGVSSINGVRSSATEQTLNHLNPKDESLSTYDLITEKSRNTVDGSSHDGLPQSLELANQAELTRDDIISQRPTMEVCSEVVVNHAAEYDTIGGSQASGTDAFVTRIPRDEKQGGSRLKDAIQAALLRKPELCRKKKVQSNEFSALNTNISCEATAQNHELASIKLKSSLSSERSNEGEAIIGSPTPESYMHSTDNSLMWHAVAATDDMFSSKIGDSDVSVSSLGKPMSKDFLNLASATSSLVLKTSAIPEYEYIWQGYFEVHRSGNFPDLSGGIQAHLSTSASPKVLEVADKFPQNLTLHEVPRSSTWPTQFQESGATEDNIALYFFAKDIESYNRSYKGLVDGMIKNDMALKGQFEGVELLIFPSNQLPKKSRRWNMLFYLWGVFRARRVHNSDISKELHFPNLSLVSVDKHPPSAVMTLLDNLASSEHVYNISPASFFDQAHEIAMENGQDKKPPAEHLLMNSNANTVLQDVKLFSESICRTSSGEDIRGTSPFLEDIILPNNRLGVEFKPPFLATATKSFNKGERMELHCNTCDRKDTLSLNILPVSNQEVGVAGSVREEKILNDSVGDELNLDGWSKERDHYKAKSEMKEDGRYVNTASWPVSGLSSQGQNSRQSDHRMRSYVDRSDSAPSVSRSINQTMYWNGGNNVLVDGATISKEPKTGSRNIYGCSTISGLTPGGDGMASRLTALGPCSLEEEKCVDTCEEKVIMEDIGSSEKYFFPVNSYPGSGDNSVPRKSFSAGVDRFSDGSPNLELALGADTKPQNKGMLPFFVGLLDKSDPEDKPPDKAIHDKEDDASASLSLSLSFPFPDKEEPKKSVSKSEQLRPERRHADTSLLLFGGLSEK